MEKREVRQEAHVARQEEKRRELEEKGRQQGVGGFSKMIPSSYSTATWCIMANASM